MSAVVRAFTVNRAASRPWQNRELAEFYRVIDILGRAGINVVPDMGTSDEGDPWFAFCRSDTGEVVVHCARIDGLFVATSSAFDRVFRGNDLRDVVNAILRFQEHTSLAWLREKRIYLHPAAVLTAFIAAALFAKHADAHDHHGSGDNAAINTPQFAKFVAAAKMVLEQQHLRPLVAGAMATTPLEGLADTDASISLGALIGVGLSSTADSSFDIFTNSSLADAQAPTPSTMPPRSFLVSFDGGLLQDSTPQHQISSTETGADSLSLPTKHPDGIIESTNSTSVSSVAQFHPQDDLVQVATPEITGTTWEAHLNYVPPPLHQGTSTAGSVLDGAQSQQYVSPAGHIFELGDFSDIALQILGIPNPTAAPPAPDAEQTIVGSNANASSSASTSAAINSPSANLGAAAGPQTAGVQANLVPASIIVIGQNPTAALGQLLDYALGNHSLQGEVHGSAELASALAGYSSQGALSLVIFDSASIKLPYFEFSKGVLFVDDHEIDMNPAQVAPANLVQVDLANGGTMMLLGVVDSSHVIF